jgi:hypothetical protein
MTEIYAKELLPSSCFLVRRGSTRQLGFPEEVRVEDIEDAKYEFYNKDGTCSIVLWDHSEQKPFIFKRIY